MGRDMMRAPPGRRSFRVRRLDGRTTVIRGRSPALGVFMLVCGLAMSGLVLLPFSFSLRGGLLGIALFVAIGLTHGYRVVITPHGITINSTWLGVPLSRVHAPLDESVDDYIPWGSDECEGVGIGFHCLPAPARDRDALKEALCSAIDRAQSCTG